MPRILGRPVKSELTPFTKKSRERVPRRIGALTLLLKT
jgi:hypothetical protein